jgi:hypothetical protein
MATFQKTAFFEYIEIIFDIGAETGVKVYFVQLKKAGIY